MSGGSCAARARVSQPETLLASPGPPVPGPPPGLRGWGVPGVAGQRRVQRPALIDKLRPTETWAGERKSRRLMKTTFVFPAPVMGHGEAHL